MSDCYISISWIQTLPISFQLRFYNIHNTHYWTIENSHVTHGTHFQRWYSVNVWAGILMGILIGSFIAESRLTGGCHSQFLRNNFSGLLEDVALDVQQAIWFLQNGITSFQKLDKSWWSNSLASSIAQFQSYWFLYLESLKKLRIHNQSQYWGSIAKFYTCYC